MNLLAGFAQLNKKTTEAPKGRADLVLGSIQIGQLSVDIRASKLFPVLWADKERHLLTYPEMNGCFSLTTLFNPACHSPQSKRFAV